MIHVLATPVFTLALLLVPGPPAPIQAPDLEDVEIVPWPTSLGAGTFGHMEAARLLPEHGRGVVAHWGSKIALAYAPGIHTLVHELEAPATAFAVLRGSFQVAGELDRLVYADSSGAWLAVFDTTQSPPTFQSSAIAGSAGLADAFALACADFDGDGHVDIAGIDESRSTVLTLLADGQGGFSAGSTFAPASEALDLRVLEWNGIVGAELALATRWGTQVFTPSGSVLWQRFAHDPGTSDDPNVVLSVVPAPLGSGGTDRLAVVQWNQAGTNQLLAVHGPDASEAPISLDHPNLGLVLEHPPGSGQYLGAVGLHAGDRDGDGDFDLALSHHRDRRVQIFLNRVAPTTYSANASFLDSIDVGKGSGLFLDHASAPLLADLDDDGRAELVFGNPEQAPLLAISHGSADIATVIGTCVEARVFENYTILGAGSLWDQGGIAVGIEIEVTNGWNTDMSSAGITHLEVVVWRQDVNDTEHVTEAIRHYVFARPAAFDGPDTTMSLGFPLDIDAGSGPLQTFFERYYVEVRPVHYDLVTETISNPLRTYAAGFTSALDSDSSSLQVLLERDGAALHPICEDGTHGTLESKYVGGLVPQLKMPVLPPATLPNIPNPPTVKQGV